MFCLDGYDIDEVMSALDKGEAPKRITDDASKLMLSQMDDTGFTYCHFGNRYILVVIGPQSSGKEFINTLVHEIHHVAVAIAGGLGIDLESETPAYLSGEMARSMADMLCSIACMYQDT